MSQASSNHKATASSIKCYTSSMLKEHCLCLKMGIYHLIKPRFGFVIHFPLHWWSFCKSWFPFVKLGILHWSYYKLQQKLKIISTFVVNLWILGSHLSWLKWHATHLKLLKSYITYYISEVFNFFIFFFFSIIVIVTLDSYLQKFCPLSANSKLYSFVYERF